MLLIAACSFAPSVAFATGISNSVSASPLEILRAAFPGATITLETGQSIDNSWNPRPKTKSFLFPDALAHQPVYQVVGKAEGIAEKCAASDVTNESSFSATRDVRFESFPWPGKATSHTLLAVFQYKFRGANPPMSCTSMARILRLTQVNSRWRASDTVVLDTTHHHSLQRIELSDLSGNGHQELLIESDWGGAGTVGSNLIVYSLGCGRFVQWLNVPTRVEQYGGDSFVQSLDLVKTRRERALRFCFDKRTYARGGQWLSEPAETHPCYQRFTRSPAGELMTDSAK